MYKLVVWTTVVVTVVVALFYFIRNKNRQHDEAQMLYQELPLADDSVEALEQESSSDDPLHNQSQSMASDMPRPRSAPSPSESAQNPEADQSSGLLDRIQDKFEMAWPVLRQKAAIAQSKNHELVHNTPKQTIQAAQALGEIAELQAQTPNQMASFREFYLECAHDEAVITVIRSQCLDHYLKLAKLDQASRDQVLSAFSPDILRLYEALQ